MAIEKILKNTRLTGSSAPAFKQYNPAQYSERQKQYFNYETRIFNEYYAKYSTDYIEVQAYDKELQDMIFEDNLMEIRY